MTNANHNHNHGAEDKENKREYTNRQIVSNIPGTT